MTSYNFWVFKHKLLGVLVLLSESAKATFDKQDYHAILYGLTQSDSSSNRYFEYMFVSEGKLTIHFAQDSEDSDIIYLQVQSEEPSTVGEASRVDRFQSCFSAWTVANEEYFLQ